MVYWVGFWPFFLVGKVDLWVDVLQLVACVWGIEIWGKGKSTAKRN